MILRWFEQNSSLNFLHFLQLSIDHKSVRIAQQCHARILSRGYNQNPFLATKLISAYATFGYPNESKLVFDSVRLKNVYLWNSLIAGFVKNQCYSEAFCLFKELCGGDVLPDDFTISTLSKVLSEVGDLFGGKLVHGRSIRNGVVLDTVVANSLMSMYCKCGDFGGCRNLFDEMPQRNVGSWNVLISGYVSCVDCRFDKEMWEVVKCMQVEGVNPDACTVSSLLPLCGDNGGKLDYGRELHCYIVKNELDSILGSDAHLGCCLIDMYSRNDKVVVGRRVFDRMKFKNVYAWTAMVNGYVKDRAFDEALDLFREMQWRDRVEPNRVSLLSVLPACSSLAGLICGKQVHGFVTRKELTQDGSLCNALIDMYSKCGSLNSARRIFDDTSFCKDAISWSSMISGYGLHGKGEEAVILYRKMLQLGVKPDMITIVGVLSACGRSGLVNAGLNIYFSVINEYGIKPTVEICACVVDMLGRSGQLDQALEFIKKMPLEPGPSVWGALLSASLLHGVSEMRDLAYRFLVQLEPNNPSNYVTVSNLYASSRRWDVVAEMRTMMKERGLRKSPGCSWININSHTHCFYVADKAHPRSDAIYRLLREFSLIMKGAGSSPDFEEMRLNSLE